MGPAARPYLQALGFCPHGCKASDSRRLLEEFRGDSSAAPSPYNTLYYKLLCMIWESCKSRRFVSLCELTRPEMKSSFFYIHLTTPCLLTSFFSLFFKLPFSFTSCQERRGTQNADASLSKNGKASATEVFGKWLMVFF